MRQRFAMTITSLMIVMLAASPAGAIQNGEPDLDAHPNVGLVGFDFDRSGPLPAFGLCSGFVISDSAFVTAAHCIQFIGLDTDWVVTMEGGSPSEPVMPPGPLDAAAPDPTDFPILVPVKTAESVHVHPDFDPLTAAHDVAVLTFPPGTFTVPAARLAPPNMLERLESAGMLGEIPAQLIGYGAGGVVSESPPVLRIDGYRQRALTAMTGVTDDQLLSIPNTQWPGQASLADSGGPLFVQGVVVALTSVDDFSAQRLDTPDEREFLWSFLAAECPDSFSDDNRHLFEGDINCIAAAGLTRGCNPPLNTAYCPDEPVNRGQVAAFLSRALVLAPSFADRFADDDASVFQADVQALAASGLTKGCNPPANDRFCPDEPVTRGQMAAFLVRALGLSDGSDQGLVDTAGTVFADDINALVAAGITRGCNPPANDRFCPHDPVTRGQMAAFLNRAILSP